jgi:hypothetical protein
LMTFIFQRLLFPVGICEFAQGRATTRHFCLQDSALNDFKHESLLHNSQQAPQATKPPSFVPP